MSKILFGAAALSPSVAFLAMQELAVSFAVTLVGVLGSFILVVVAMVAAPKVEETLIKIEEPGTEYPSLITASALHHLQNQNLDPVLLRVRFNNLVTQTHGPEGFATSDDQVAMVLSQIMARWRLSDAVQLSDDQARELWLIERLMRSTPAEAGQLACHFASPKELLAVRDRIAGTVSV